MIYIQVADHRDDGTTSLATYLLDGDTTAAVMYLLSQYRPIGEALVPDEETGLAIREYTRGKLIQLSSGND